MTYYSEKIEVEARKQVALYKIMSEGEVKKPLKKCDLTDEDVEFWLYSWLKARGFLLSDYVKHVAREMGISATRPRRARKNLGVATWHWVDEKDHPGYWFWEITS